MTEKLVNVAIFWLPLIAGIVLGGLAPSIWYGGDKLSALWIAFFGVVCLLLTGTFQLQQYISATILQPSLELTPSADRFVLKWDPSISNLLNIRGENDTTPPANWRVPTFALRNLSTINAQDVTFRWSAKRYEAAQFVANAPQFQGKQLVVQDGNLTIAKPNTAPAINPFEFSASTNLAFVTRSAEPFIPLQVWNTAALQLIGTTPAELNGKSEPYFFDLVVSWNIPEGGQPDRFRIKVVATNTKPAGSNAEYVGAIEFSVEKLAR
jgi:hypothetical protein